MLRSSSKADVLKLFNEQRSKSPIPLPPLAEAEIGQFRWLDLARNGRYQLVTTSSYPCVSFLAINDPDASGKIYMVQTIEGWADLKTGIRDLNGDGKDELIVQKPLVEYDCASVVTWPAVYRLENGKYVEASKDFPSYYDDEALPAINSEIDRLEAKDEYLTRKRVLSLTMARDKILRVLGRDPTAGLSQAYQWMNSDNSQMLQCALATFSDIGGHEKEVQTLQKEIPGAIARSIEARKGE